MEGGGGTPMPIEVPFEHFKLPMESVSNYTEPL
jgi:hypothetical protein